MRDLVNTDWYTAIQLHQAFKVYTLSQPHFQRFFTLNTPLTIAQWGKIEIMRPKIKKSTFFHSD